MYAVVLTLICVVATACAPRYADFFPYHDNGTKKPSLSLVGVCDVSNSPIVKNFPAELSKAVRNRLKRNGKLFCPPVSQTFKEMGSATMRELSETSDLKLFNRFRGTDYVAVIETVEAQVLPYKRGAFKPLYLAAIDEQTAKVLSIAMRLRIINLKGNEPKVARMELVQSNHMMTSEDITLAEKGDHNTLEMVRSRLARDLAQKIEETVCVKK